MIAVALLLEMPADTMFVPGAKRSRHFPKFEKLARESASFVAPTASTETLLPEGDVVHASTFELPAATTTVMPSANARSTADSSDGLWVVPRLMFITAGRVVWSAITQSIAAITPETVPAPLQSSARTATREACGATPKVEPAMVPAT